MSKAQKIKAVISAAMALAGAIVMLTPGTKDDRFFNMVQRAYAIIESILPIDEPTEDSPEDTIIIDA